MPQYSSRSAHALIIIAIVLGDHVISAKRGIDFTLDNASVEGGSLEEFEVQSSLHSSCRDPARHRLECSKWSHFCPSNQSLDKASQPVEFDQFMVEWCPKTCGVCKGDVQLDPAADDFDILQFAGGDKVSAEKTCSGTRISRRRRGPGNMCSCRRRSGVTGLPMGWACDDKVDRVVYEGIEEHRIKRDARCCCKSEACSHESVRRGDAVAHTSADGTPICCKLKASSWFFGTCPKTSGYNQEHNFSKCSRNVTASVSICSDRQVQWLSDQKWYKTVGGWEVMEEDYSSYVPCMTPKDMHVMTVMLGVRNALAKVEMPNPMRAFIMSQPECAGLSGLELVQSTTSAYKELCPFGTPHKSYRPNLVHEGTCFYDPLDKTIYLKENRMCAEGHRCACPVFQANSVGVQSAYDAYYTYSVFSSVLNAGKSGANALAMASGLTSIIGIPAISSAGAAVAGVLMTYTWPLTIGIGAVGLVAFGSSYVWKWAQHSCSEKVGCYPMDCVEEPGRGCRIRAPLDYMDERNPFWFLPPPTYKCAYKYGMCKLSRCSKTNLWNQTVGISKTRSLLKKGYTQVYNCQPMVNEDMSSRQRVRLEKSTADLKEEYETARRQNQRMRRAMETVCPWSRPTKENVFRCKHLRSCKGSLESQSCCDDYGGIQQCPENIPLLCNNGYCGNDEDLCETRGGVRSCPSANACPWILPTPVVSSYMCQDGSYSSSVERPFWESEPQPCQEEGQGGVRRCPWDRPVMCNDRTCSGDYCCAKNCKDKGGPRLCNASSLVVDASSLVQLAFESNASEPRSDV